MCLCDRDGKERIHQSRAPQYIPETVLIFFSKDAMLVEQMQLSFLFALIYN